MRRFPLALVALSLLSTSFVHAEERPFKASGSGGLEYGSSPKLIGECYATHLGQSVLVVTLDEYELAEGNLAPATLAIYGAHDALFATVDASFDPETGIIAGTITFVGGSGRFADATGSADLLMVFDDWTGLFGNSRFDVAIAGTIDY